jgi:hypothetical protein
MLIQCLIRRKNGSTVTFDANSAERLGLPPGSYHFAPRTAEDDAPHVAEVTNPAHIDHFLTIPGFRVLHDLPVTPTDAPKLSKPVKAFDADAVQKLSVRDLREQVEHLDAEQVRAVLQLEQDQGDDARSSVVELLMSRLRKIEAQ